MPLSSDTALRPPARISPYSPHELLHFQALLLEQQAGIFECCEGLSGAVLHRSWGSQVDSSGTSRAGGGGTSESFDQDLSSGFLDRAQAELAEISRAIEKIDARSYGVCDDCGDRIPLGRLQALPTASFCLACKVRSETFSSRLTD